VLCNPFSLAEVSRIVAHGLERSRRGAAVGLGVAGAA
jgi:hypothetical protein